MEAEFLQSAYRLVVDYASTLAGRCRLLPSAGAGAEGAEAAFGRAAADFDPADALAGCRAAADAYDQIRQWSRHPRFRQEIGAAAEVLRTVFWGYARLVARKRDPESAREVEALAARFQERRVSRTGQEAQEGGAG